ncbi:MAG TPA: PAS domain S-box protein [Pirellulaceae bacterium]|jgi:PAS domain S-box-containing protein
MNRHAAQQNRCTSRRDTRFGLHLAIGIALLLVAAVADITKPFDKSWTILYLLPMLYVGWKIRGWIEVAFYATAIATTFLVPIVFRPQLLWGGTGFFNRTLGALIGMLVIFLIWERRRYVDALENSNEELERRVALRVLELEIANRKLAEDIEQRQRADQELRESESRFRTFVDHATDAFFLHDEQGIVRDVNKQACDSLGYSRGELLGMNPMQFDPELTRERMQQIAAQLDAGETVRFDSIHRRKDHSEFPVELRIRPFRSQGKCFRVALARDISERKMGEQALRESEQRFRQLSDSAFEGLLIREQEIIRDANRALADLFGIPTVEEMIGRHCLEVIPLTPESREVVRQQLQSPKDCVIEVSARWPDGTVRVLETQSRPIFFRGRPGRVVAVRDVTERKQAEEERRKLAEERQQAQTLESLGVLAGGIAHDFNNLLTVINGNCHLLRTKLAEHDPSHVFAAAIHAAGTQAAKLMRQLLLFSRGVSQEPAALDVNQMVAQSGEIWRQVVGEEIEMVVDCGENLWPVVVDRGQIEQVLLNLVLNARDAMPDGGRIVVKTRNTEKPPAGGDSPGDNDSDNQKPSRFIQISVEDTGVGMSESVRARIFEPFFTTKSIGQGIGLGLPMCHGIVKQSGGWIDVSSKPGRGSIFFVMLPSKPSVNQAHAEQLAASAAAASSQ